MSTSRPTNYAAGFIIGNFLLTHFLYSDRVFKAIYKIDHNSCPREDLDKYGARAVKEGKISQQTFDLLKRSEGAHKNALDHMPLFIGTMIFALHAGLPTDVVNTFGAAYTVTRFAYTASYLAISSTPLSYIRSALWWVSNIACIATLYQCGQAINA